MSSKRLVHYSRKPKPYQTPPELQDEKYLNLPLYMLVAYWALLKGIPVTVKDVRLTFNISLRRASDLLEYITEQGAKAVESELFLIPSPRGGKCKCRALRIISINGEHVRFHSSTSAINDETNQWVEEEPDSSEYINELRRWVVQRRAGDSIPKQLTNTGEA
ncbi:CaiF/GrlA family transcriptional regulator [Citrobacter amalonaticus]|uniref:CaiF/GrlA family transcriptional regulator n=1 Tax=Citrobacter amalonaticus TaxID=35703 RepID=UPI0028794478|nr:CaiF/GrlA family transcriptional regulator [Citrobacter amalonaticus]MDS4039469.1 CaiF/GrlA family transcriptional regulator [Citrobacter amalonaticus]